MFNDNFNYSNPYITFSPLIEENEKYIIDNEEKIFPFVKLDDFLTENYFTTREESNQKEKNQLNDDNLREDLPSKSNKKTGKEEDIIKKTTIQKRKKKVQKQKSLFQKKI